MRGQVPAITWAVASRLATYGDAKTGRECRAGVKRLSGDLQLGSSTVRRHLDALREAGWVERVSSGSPAGLRGAADEYRLTVPNHRPPASTGEAEPPPASEQTSARQRAEPPPASEHPPAQLPDQDQQPRACTREEPSSRPAAGNGETPVSGALAARVVAELGCSLDEADHIIRAEKHAAEARGRPINRLAAYITKALDTNPGRLRKHLPPPRCSPSPASLPPPCGQCDARPDDQPAARVVWLGDGRPAPCPRCHPSVVTHATP